MREWEFIDHSAVPGDEGVIYLSKRGSEYAIHVDGRQLMTNREHGSEAALADLACDRLDERADARILVGGLGMGFTLAAALRRVQDQGQVTVAELLESVVRWNREHVGRASGHPLRDPRTRVHVGDVADLLDVRPDPWCAILLDVDNGPQALTRPVNAWLYTDEGLRGAFDSLRSGGILAIWSAHPDDGLTERLDIAGFDVEIVAFTEEGRESYDGNSTDTLWFARRP